MKLTIEGTPEDIKKVLNTISGSEEHKELTTKEIYEASISQRLSKMNDQQIKEWFQQNVL